MCECGKSKFALGVSEEQIENFLEKAKRTVEENKKEKKDGPFTGREALLMASAAFYTVATLFDMDTKEMDELMEV